MSNIFNTVAKYFGSQSQVIKPEAYQTGHRDNASGLVVMGYSVVYLEPRSKSNVNNFDNL